MASRLGSIDTLSGFVFTLSIVLYVSGGQESGGMRMRSVILTEQQEPLSDTRTGLPASRGSPAALERKRERERKRGRGRGGFDSGFKPGGIV